MPQVYGSSRILSKESWAGSVNSEWMVRAEGGRKRTRGLHQDYVWRTAHLL